MIGSSEFSGPQRRTTQAEPGPPAVDSRGTDAACLSCTGRLLSDQPDSYYYVGSLPGAGGGPSVGHPPTRNHRPVPWLRPPLRPRLARPAGPAWVPSPSRHGFESDTCRTRARGSASLGATLRLRGQAASLSETHRQTRQAAGESGAQTATGSLARLGGPRTRLGPWLRVRPSGAST